MKIYAVGVGNAFSMRNYHQSFLLEEKADLMEQFVMVYKLKSINNEISFSLNQVKVIVDAKTASYRYILFQYMATTTWPVPKTRNY